MSLSDIRREYTLAALDESHVDHDPIIQFQRWLHDAITAQVDEPTAATLATATRDGSPSARIVLLKGVDARGFTFFTDYRSRKGREIGENPRVALCVFWSALERQVRITGTVTQVAREESEAYFRSRPLESRMSAWASHQSAVIANRAELEARVREVEARHLGADPPLPPHWGGYRVAPTEIEFWQGRASRLHDRIAYVKSSDAWRFERLSP